MNKKELQKLLSSSGIDLDRWNKGAAKGINDLLNEINSGESILKKGVNKKLSRKVGVVYAKIIYCDKATGVRYALKEEKQVFSDGRERVRKIDFSMAEKMKSGENPKIAIKRGVAEELGISGKLKITPKGKVVKIKNSSSYPGLITEYIFYSFLIELDKNQFNPDGYTEKEGSTGLTSSFCWKKSKPAN